MPHQSPMQARIADLRDQVEVYRKRGDSAEAESRRNRDAWRSARQRAAERTAVLRGTRGNFEHVQERVAEVEATLTAVRKAVADAKACRGEDAGCTVDHRDIITDLIDNSPAALVDQPSAEAGPLHALADALLRSRDSSWPQLIAHARHVQRENAMLWRQFDAIRGRDGIGPDREVHELRAAVEAALQAEVGGLFAEDRPAGPLPVAVDAVMPIAVRLLAQRDGAAQARDRAERQIRYARDLAARWLSQPNERAWNAGHELNGELDKGYAAAQQGVTRPQLAGVVEVRDPCPHCPGPPLIPRAEMRRHIHEKHADAVLNSPPAACRQMETRTCPPSYGGPCGDRPCARFESDDPTPWEH